MPTGDEHGALVGEQCTGSGDPDGFESFFRSNYGPMVQVLSAADPDAVDAVQEAFAKAHQRWSQLSTTGDEVAWTRRAAVRALRDARRTALRRLGILRRTWPPGHLAVVDEQRDVDLTDAIGRLPPRQRLALALFYFGDLPVEDVAAAMGVTAGTVKATLHAARRNLRSHLGGLDA